jgi:hypothetical protein
MPDPEPNPDHKYATIKVYPDTRDDLRAAKVGDETYDELLSRLLRESGELRVPVSQLSDSGA